MMEYEEFVDVLSTDGIILEGCCLYYIVDDKLFFDTYNKTHESVVPVEDLYCEYVLNPKNFKLICDDKSRRYNDIN